MEKRPFGSTGVDLPVIGQGTWRMEGQPREAIAAIRRGVEAGMTHIDTAEMYGAGAVEELLAEALVGLRDRVFLTSKVLSYNASFEGTIAACEASLRRLSTDRLDLYLLHWPGTIPLYETFRAFDTLQQQGKILASGVSNFDVDELEAALEVAGPGRIACNQVCYSLTTRYIEAEIIPWCHLHGVAVVGYSPFGSTGSVGLNDPGGRVVQKIARSRGATPHQVALSFLVRHPALFTIPKSSDERHVLENAAAAKLLLDEDELSHLDAAFPVRTRGGLPIL